MDNPRERSLLVVVVAVMADVTVTAFRFAIAAVTGSSALLAQAFQSTAETANQLLLLRGHAGARRDETPRHPFGSAAIGCLLVVVALGLARRMKSLLIGESAPDEDLDTIRAIVRSHHHVEGLISLRGLQYGPDELLIEAQVTFDDDLVFRDIARAIDDIEGEIRARVPGTRLVAIEPAVPQPGDPDVPAWQ